MFLLGGVARALKHLWVIGKSAAKIIKIFERLADIFLAIVRQDLKPGGIFGFFIEQPVDLAMQLQDRADWPARRR